MSKSFFGAGGRQVEAVRNLTLTIEDKELLVLAGPSGCGKTTTLRLIAGLEEPSVGEIFINEKPVNNRPAADRQVAMVFQNLALYPHMSAYDNMAFGLKARQIPKTEIGSRIEEAVSLLDLRDCLDRMPDQLSGGQRQRVALGRAIALRPEVLLLDEPLSNLDAPLRWRMRAELIRLHRKLGTTMIYVTHDQIEAMTLGEQIALMDRGELQQVAGPLTLYHQPANLFAASFLGAPPMNMFRGAIVRRSEKLYFEEQTSGEATAVTRKPFAVRIPPAFPSRCLEVPHREVILGIRPENVLLGDGQENGVSASVERIERLGAEVHLHLRTTSHLLVVRSTDTEMRTPHNELRLRFDMTKACFFDANDGKTLQ